MTVRKFKFKKFKNLGLQSNNFVFVNTTRMDTVVNRFILEKRPFYFRSEWSSKQFELSITDGKHVWQGKGKHLFIIASQTNSGCHIHRAKTQTSRNGFCRIHETCEERSHEARRATEKIRICNYANGRFTKRHRGLRSLSFSS